MNCFDLSKKSVASILILIIFIGSYSPMFAKKAEAGWPVIDWANLAVNAPSFIAQHSLFIKEYALDAVAYKMLDLIIQKMAASTISWINSGFRGSPAFVTDPSGYFKDIGDKVAGDFISKNQNLNFLCSPISIRVKIALAQNYSGYNETWQCTLSDVYGNIDDFMNDFERGGWDKFFRLTQEAQNNPVGAYLQAEGSLARLVSQEVGEKQQELSWGKGFLSFQTCERYPLALPGETQPSCIPGTEKTETPGSVIESKLNSVLSIGDHKLAVADEINEIINALLNQLTNRIIGGIGSGLRSLSRPDSTNNNQVFTNELANPANNSAIDNYFNASSQSVVDTLNLPPINPYACRDDPSLPECNPPPGAEGYCDPSDAFCMSCRDNPTSPECQGITP